MEKKEDIRKIIKEQKKLLQVKEIQEKSSLIHKYLFQLPEYKKAHCIYSFVSFNQEVRTDKIITSALTEGKRVAVPKIEGEKMIFYYISDYEELKKGTYGILEPGTSLQALEPAALILLPGLAFDLKGHRIGYGKGYYDNYLGTYPMDSRIGICYDFQKFREIPSESRDIKVNQLITEAGVFNLNI